MTIFWNEAVGQLCHVDWLGAGEGGGKGAREWQEGRNMLSFNRTKILPLSAELPSEGARFGASNFQSVLKHNQAGGQALPAKSS